MFECIHLFEEMTVYFEESKIRIYFQQPCLRE